MSDAKKRPYRKKLDPEWARALLTAKPNTECEAFDYLDKEEIGSVADLLKVADEIWQEALTQAHKAIKEHPLTDLVAQEAAKRTGRRGDPLITVDEEGVVVLEIRYKKGWTSDLPSLTDLRKEAESLGLDVSDCGRSKKQVLKRIEEAKKSTKPKKPKMVKTAPALSPVRIVSPPAPASPRKNNKPPEKGSLAALALQGEEFGSDDLDDFLADVE